MSSLRVGTLRLCWLEAFLTVVEQENISGAARVLKVDQSTVSRYLADLQTWLGKKLIEAGGIVDPDDPRVSIRVTDDGQAFFPLAEKTVADLLGFRDEKARERELLKEMSAIVTDMESDRDLKKNPHLTKKIRSNLDMFRATLDAFTEDVPLDVLTTYRDALRKFYISYEKDRKRERYLAKRSLPLPKADESLAEIRKKRGRLLTVPPSNDG